MKWKDAAANLKQAHPEDTLHPLYTPWGEKIAQENQYEDIWPEYPRPQLKRENYRMLNGAWDYAIVPIETVSTDTVGKEPVSGSSAPSYPAFQGTIRVPFSPECLLSGVGKTLMPEEYLWYHRDLTFSEEELVKKQAGCRCLLHFEAVDQEASVYLNDTLVASHSGGYLPFSADITDFVSAAPVPLYVRVRDLTDTSYATRGKQTLQRGGMFYTPQSGIWQSVWYEWVPSNYIVRYEITPDYDNACVKIVLFSHAPFSDVTCKVSEADCTVTERRTEAVERDGLCRTVLTLVFSEPFLPWTPETPHLYTFRLQADEDCVEGYFAMRCFTVEPDEDGMLRFCLNHKPYFLHGLLDQGYWSDGLMTAPCDEALIYDITLAKDLGFNMLRKHIKIENERWYYHCDRLGMIVWQDMVSGGTTYHMPWVCYLPTLFPHMSAHTKDHHYKLFSRASKEGRDSWEKECLDTIDHLYNVPSIAVWVPFNEGWGQFDAARIAKMVAKKDPSRPLDHASGWFDQKAGDFRSIHNYFRPLKVKSDGKRAFVISEYGGYACHIEDHSSVDRIYGYRKYANLKDLEEAVNDLFDHQLFPLVAKGLSGAVYTQLSDVEEEVNGLVTYDRRVVKLQGPDTLPHL